MSVVPAFLVVLSVTFLIVPAFRSFWLSDRSSFRVVSTFSALKNKLKTEKRDVHIPVVPIRYEIAYSFCCYRSGKRSGFFKEKLNQDRRGPRPLPNICPPQFSLQTTFIS
jgi:hypothetical protein